LRREWEEEDLEDGRIEKRIWKGWEKRIRERELEGEKDWEEEDLDDRRIEKKTNGKRYGFGRRLLGREMDLEEGYWEER